MLEADIVLFANVGVATLTAGRLSAAGSMSTMAKKDGEVTAYGELRTGLRRLQQGAKEQPAQRGESCMECIKRLYVVMRSL